jgi:hypothetical protein
MKHRRPLSLLTVLGAALCLGGPVGAAPKDKRVVQVARAVKSVPNSALDKWWMQEGGTVVMYDRMRDPSSFAVPVPMSAAQKDCVGVAFRPKISDWRRKQITADPNVDFSKDEEETFVGILDKCGMTVPIILFSEADIYGLFLPATTDCLVDAWAKHPDWAKSYLATKVFHRSTPSDTANRRTLIQGCLTPTDVAALQKKVDDMFAAVNKAMG